MLRIDPALPMDRIEPTLPMLRMLPKLKTLPTLKKLKMLSELLALSGPARLPVLTGARLHLERVDLPMIDPSMLDTSSLINPSPESLTASPTVSPRCSHTETHLFLPLSFIGWIFPRNVSGPKGSAVRLKY
jgi:hypothetical protein